MIDLKNKVAFITGANRGIGKYCALKLASCGCNIAFINRDQQTGASAKEEIAKLGVEVINFQGDISNSEDVKNAVQQTIEKFAKIDFLINNAGITQDMLFLRMSDENWDSVLDINLKGLFLTTRAVAKYMLKAKTGKIINIGSVVGYTGNPGQVNYAASKSALIGFTKSIAKELGSRNILCNLIAAGFIETEMTKKLTEKQSEEILKQIPLKKMGTGEDVANGVLFLCSSMSDYVTGTTIHINGGMF